MAALSDKSFYSNDWHRVSGLKLRLRANAGITRQTFRGDLWYVLQDQASGKFHRFNPEAWLVISLLNGERSVEEVWRIACERLGDDVLTQNEIIHLLSQLHQADVLQGDVMPDVAEMLQKAEKQSRKKMAMSLINPLALRLPIFDPDALLDGLMPFVRPFLGWFGALLFLGLVINALMLLGIHWEQFTGNISDRLLATESMILLVLTYPVVKLFHEFGHGFAVKRWGGEVHEMGVMFLVFMPVPYVDASAASRFTGKWQRAFVGAAGIIVELLLASLAMLVWVYAEDGLVRAFAFNVMLIGGASTLVFNGNPLLRFDGYYVLSDLIEIPNLGPKANRYIGYLIKHYLFGLKSEETPATGAGEEKWLFTFSIASFVYRLFIVGVIILYVASIFPMIGVMLAIWSLVMMFGVPLAKQAWFLLASPKLRRHRTRAFAVTGAVIGAAGFFVAAVPLPYGTMAQGVIWTPQEAAIYAAAPGHVVALYAYTDMRVQANTTLVQMEDPMLDAHVVAVEAKVQGLSYSMDAATLEDPVEARVIRERLAQAKEDLMHAKDLQARLSVRSPAEGRLVLPEGDDLIGRFFHQGDLIGYVLDFRNPIIVAAVPEASADLVRSDTVSVQIRFDDDISKVREAHVKREVPQITDHLPMAALATAGGGGFVTQPGADGEMKSLEKVLHLELELERVDDIAGMGGRVHVLFRHEPTSILTRAWRQMRQLFLREFNV